MKIYYIGHKAKKYTRENDNTKPNYGFNDQKYIFII